MVKNYGELLALIREMGSDAKILAEEILGERYERFLLFKDKEIEREKSFLLDRAFDRLNKDEPLQYILGKWEFSGREFFVGEGVLIPREDTLAVTELVKEYINEKSIFADLGSGSGAIAATLSLDTLAKGYAVEKSKQAFCYLEKNIKNLGANVECINADMFSRALLESLPPLDAVVSNPPYITEEEMKSLDKNVLKEPREALCGGEDGLYFYREISRSYYPKLKEGGVVAFEVGYTQADAVLEILKECGYKDFSEKKDINGIRRALCAIK